jgi:hypothetical protein
MTMMGLQFLKATLQGLPPLIDDLEQGNGDVGQQFNKLVRKSRLAATCTLPILEYFVPRDSTGPAEKTLPLAKLTKLLPHNHARVLHNFFGLNNIGNKCKNEQKKPPLGACEEADKLFIRPMFTLLVCHVSALNDHVYAAIFVLPQPA